MMEKEEEKKNISKTGKNKIQTIQLDLINYYILGHIKREEKGREQFWE